MPAIITHDMFGQEVYEELYRTIGGTRDEYHAFLLGNQGPDPLFYSILVPTLHSFTKLGTTMHSEKPTELLYQFKRSLSILDADEYPIGHAYALGFLCHYVLDSNMHPLVFSQEYALCDAGIEGFSRQDGSEVHAVIESEFDEMVLFLKQDRTVATFNPATEILRGNDTVLQIISKMYAYVATTVYGLFIPENMYASCVKSFRRAESFFHSRTGAKRFFVGRAEELFRPYSFFRSMSPRAIELRESQFDNHEHALWKNPFTGEVSTKGFWDIFDASQAKAKAGIGAFAKEGFDRTAAEGITHDLDFSGDPTVAILVVEEQD